MTLNNPTARSACLQNLKEPEARNQYHNQNKDTALNGNIPLKTYTTLFASDTRYEVMQ
jgi:hypothetical protein